MKENEIIDVVKSRFKAIDKLLHPILKDFNADDIYDFRVEVKKLRAFLRLMNAEKKVESPLIPKLLKTFYGYIGIIRNIQLHRHNIFKFITDHKLVEPAGYINILDNEQLYWKNDATDLMADNNFKDNERDISKQLPIEIEKPLIKKFAENAMEELKEALQNVKDDGAIYTVRGILKDVLYTWDFIKDDAQLPTSISNPEDLKWLTTNLDSFRDKCSELELLKPEHLDKVHDEKEKAVLIKIEEEFRHEKELIKQTLLQILTDLRNQL